VVSADVFATLGVRPSVGRAFRTEEDHLETASGARPLMLTHSTWTRRFGGDPGAVGRIVVVDEKRFEVIGVTPRDLFPLETEPIEYFVTAGVNGEPSQKGSANASRGYRAYDGVFARLAPGVSLNQARAEMDAVNQKVRRANPTGDQKIVVRVTPLREVLVGDATEKLWLLLGVVGTVLLIACVNVANLLLTRAATRQREVAIRFALGASRLAITRQMLAESLLLGLVGAFAGLLLSVWMVQGLVAILPEDLPRLAGILPDGRVLLFTALLGLGTALCCGLFPSLSITRGGVAAAIKDGGRSLSADIFRGRVRKALVVSEVALAMTLLVGAGLLTNSLLRLDRVQPGFETRGTLTAKLFPTGSRYSTGDFKPDRLNQFLDLLTERVRALPGVSEVSHAQSVPLTGVENNTRFTIVDAPSDGDQPQAQLRFIGADYFGLLKIPVKQGRAFTAGDRPGAPDVAIVNESFVRSHFGGANPVGRRLKMGWGGDQPKEIVGVVGDVRHRSLGDETRPEMYVPQAQFPNAGITLLVRTKPEVDSPERLAGAITAAVRSIDPEMPVTMVRSLEAWREASLATPRLNAALLSGLSLVALLLTLVGLYGVMSYSVAQRSREMGLRMAIGAKAGDVERLVLGEGMRLVALGVATGVPAALVLTRLMSSLLFGVAPSDPATYLIITALLSAVAALACLVPARRATRVDPMIALRCE
jgi:putative ABC transport system permease protein